LIPSFASRQWYFTVLQRLASLSTYSINFGNIHPKAALGQQDLDSANKWHIVSSGGAKARANSKNSYPHPCRYDEYERFLPAANAIGISHVVIGKLTAFRL
jgi:hypothetical protein